MPRGESWHIPTDFGSPAQSPEQSLHVVFLQRMSEEERDQVIQSLRSTDDEFKSRLDFPATSPRHLVARPWIRDYWPSSAVILQIAKGANKREEFPLHDPYRSLILADSGWEAGNVIAARWEGVDGDERFNAVRVPMNVANTLLSTCDANEGLSLSQALGQEIYEEAKIDFYEDAHVEQHDQIGAPPQRFEWPDCLPHDLKLPDQRLHIVALKALSEDVIEKLTVAIVGSEKTSRLRSHDTTIHNWTGEPCSRKDLHHIFLQMCKNSQRADDKILAFFVDNILEAPDGEPQILAAFQYGVRQQTENSVKLVPIPANRVLELWRAHLQGDDESEDLVDDHGDIWSREVAMDLDCDHCDISNTNAAAVFFLQRFDAKQQRHIRAAMSALDDVEDGEDWGNDYIWLGYLWPEGSDKRTIQDLRDLFEKCDPYSSSYDPKKTPPYPRFKYPNHFMAVDDRVFEDEPQVLLASSLDFHSEETFERLGWTYGYVPARTAHINWVNYDVVNAGPEESIDDYKRLWLSDVKEYSANEWAREHEGEEAENEQDEVEDVAQNQDEDG